MHWIAAISRSRVVYSAAEYEGLDAPRPKMGMLDERAESTLCAVWAANTTGTAVLPGLRAADGQGS